MTIDVASRIKELLRRRNLKVKDLSQISGLDSFTINNLLQGRSKKLEHLIKIAEALNVQLESLISEETFLEVALYRDAVSICCEVLTSENIKKCPSTFLDDLFLRVYNVLQHYDNPSEIKMYIKGILDTSHKHYMTID